MGTDHLVFFSVPGLRPGDVSKAKTPTLFEWAATGAIAELVPTFPCVTSPVQASMSTGVPPGDHGVVANGLFHRDRKEVEFWVAPNSVVSGEQVWDAIHANRPGLTSAVWHAQNIKGSGADFVVTPAPIHLPDGSTKPWCYSKPDGLYQRMSEAMGHFPLQHYWGPAANIESTRWILNASAWLINEQRPNYNWIYVPQLDYAAQKFGPDSAEAGLALVELDRLLGEFAERVTKSPIGSDVVYLVAGEYAMTDVRGALYPNRILRQAGLLNVCQQTDGELPDLARSRAFAMVDHQIAHVYVHDSDPRMVDRCAEVLRGMPGMAGVYMGAAREQIGMNHKRCGDVVIISDEDRWFAYYWWLDDNDAPAFARTVDIHRKPGYDPVELFVDPATRGISLNADLVKGSHGAPATGRRHRTALICSQASQVVGVGESYSDTDVKRITLELLGAASTG